MMKVNFNGLYVAVQPQIENSGAVILRVTDANPRPRREVLVMRSPNKDGEERNVIHHCIVDYEDNAPDEMLLNGQVKQKYGEGQFLEDRIKSVSISSNSLINLEITVREFRFPKSQVEAANPTHPALSVYCSFYQFYNSSGQNFLKLRVIDSFNKDQSFVFKQENKTQRFYSGLPVLNFERKIIIDFSTIIEEKRRNAKNRRSQNFIKKLAEKNKMNKVAVNLPSQELYEKQLSEDDNLFMEISTQPLSQKKVVKKKRIGFGKVRRSKVILKNLKSGSAKRGN